MSWLIESYLNENDNKDSEKEKVFETKNNNPLAILKGHSDWVFGSKFVNDNALVSGGRDGKFCLWKLNNIFETNNPVEVFPFLIEEYPERVKVRCVNVHRIRKQCFSLTTNGFLNTWDAELMVPVDSRRLDDTNDLLTMDVHQNNYLLSIGSKYYTSIIDTRNPTDVLIIGHVDIQWGVRSLLFVDDYLIIGGGSGHVSFVDLRMPVKHILYHKCKGIIRNEFNNQN